MREDEEETEALTLGVRLGLEEKVHEGVLLGVRVSELVLEDVVLRD